MDIEKELARAYYKLLTSVDWKDKTLVDGLGEGLKKFLANAHISSLPGVKHHKTHYISDEALAILNSGTYKGRLIFEHIVPQTEYILKPCEKLAKAGSLTQEFVEEKLKKYWILATITTEENSHLGKELKNKMPNGWTESDDLFARYKKVGIDISPNPFYKKTIGTLRS